MHAERNILSWSGERETIDFYRTPILLMIPIVAVTTTLRCCFVAYSGSEWDRREILVHNCPLFFTFPFCVFSTFI